MIGYVTAGHERSPDDEKEPLLIPADCDHPPTSLPTKGKLAALRGPDLQSGYALPSVLPPQCALIQFVARFSS